MRIDYIGYTVYQASNNHIQVYKGRELVMQEAYNEKCTEEELRSKVDEYLKLAEEYEDPHKEIREKNKKLMMSNNL